MNILFLGDAHGHAQMLQEIVASINTAQPWSYLATKAPYALPLQTIHTTTLAAGLKYLADEQISVALLDLAIEGHQGLDAFFQVQMLFPDLPLILLADRAAEALAIQAVQYGAEDYLLKDDLLQNPAARSLLERSLTYALEHYQIYGHEQLSLQEAERERARFRRMIDDQADGMVLVDHAGMIQFINPAAEKLLGRKAADLIGEVLGSSLVVNELTEVYIIREDGITSVAEMHVGATVWEGEAALLVSLRDMTERKREEKKLEAAETKYRTLVEHIPAVMYIAALDEVTHPLYVSPYVETLLGFSPAEWLADPMLWFQQLHPDDPSPTLERLHLTHSLGKPVTVEYRLFARNGSIIWVREVSALVCDDMGQACFVQGAMLDITDLKRAEQEIHRLNGELEQRVIERTAQLGAANRELESEISERKRAEEALKGLTRQLSRSRDLLRTLFDVLGDGLLLLDNTGVVLAINQAMAKLIGMPPEELVNQEWTELCQRTDPPFPGRWMLQTLNDRRAHRRRETYTPNGGSMRIFDMQIFPLLSAGQQVDQMVIHVVDVTEQLQLETLAIQNERFVASDKLAAAIAHEINTPLQSIQNCLYLATQTNIERRTTYLDLAREEIDRISVIVRQLLDLHRPPADSVTLLDVNTLIERVLLLTGSTLARQGIDVQRDFSSDLPLLWGFPDQMMQVLLNLILNAMDAMPDGGRIVLRTSAVLREDEPSMSALKTTGAKSRRYTAVKPKRGQPTSAPTSTLPEQSRVLIIEIVDTGSGIDAEMQQRIFEPFFTTKPNGSGLGLAISQKIMNQHRGSIAVRSNLDGGSTFTLTFPVTAERSKSYSLS